MMRDRFIFILLIMSTLIYLEAKGDDELHNYRCQHKNSNDYIFNCTECLWTKGNINNQEHTMSKYDQDVCFEYIVV